MIQFSSGAAYAFDKPLGSWVVVNDSWWAGGSDAWNTRASTRSSASGGGGYGQGVVAQLEASISPSSLPFANGNNDEKEKPKWWSEALTLGHLESRMHSARVLEGGGTEFKQALLLYSKRLADEGFRGKAEELVKELCGPIYWRPSSASSSSGGGNQGWGWGREETICGIGRRELLKDVLTQFGKLI
jgi:protein HIRA/HIR1